MIVDHECMQAIEKASGLTVIKMMESAGTACAAEISADFPDVKNILILAGKGNNGGDGFVIARLLKDKHVRVYLADGAPKSKEAISQYRKLPEDIFIKDKSFSIELKKADLVIDAVYGFSFHGFLDQEIKKIFKEVNESNKKIVSIDINSGCESDSGFCDSDAIRSEITLALDCWKPFHMLRKNHQRFKEKKLLSLNLPHPDHSNYYEMNEDLFFQNFPKKEEDAYKGSFGKAELIGGCWGMAGALSLNIIGAMTVGVSYLQVVLPEEIYTISASQFIQPVFHPFGHETWHDVISGAMDSVRSVGFGSGCVYMDHKEDILDLILQECHCPVVLDAEALRLLKHNTYVLRFIKAPVILTPHIQEFADLVNQPISAVKDNPLPLALKFAKDYGVIVVLKSPNTIVVSPSGDIYINQSGNQGLAQAGSGDLLTGIMTGLLSMTRDVFTAVCMAVWLHGYLADLGVQHHSRANLKLSSYPEIMDELFMKHGF